VIETNFCSKVTLSCRLPVVFERAHMSTRDGAHMAQKWHIKVYGKHCALLWEYEK